MSETISTSTEDIEVLAQAIIDLNNGQIEQVSDSALLYDLSEHVKPYIDRLIALRQGDSRLANSENSAEGQSKSKKTRKKRKIRRRNPEGPLPELDSLAPQEKAHWIFMERFIPLERNQEFSRIRTLRGGRRSLPASPQPYDRQPARLGTQHRRGKKSAR